MDYDDLIFPNTGMNAQDIEYYVQNVEYPLDKNDVMYWARMNRAPDRVLAALNQLPERVYHSFDELDFYVNKAVY
jgi:hypothetical protein